MLIQIAQTAARLHLEVFDTIGKIVNEEHPDLVLASEKYVSFGARILNKVMERVDCRPYRNILIYQL